MAENQEVPVADYGGSRTPQHWPMPVFVGVIGALYWLYALVSGYVEMPGMIRFMSRVLTLFVFLVAFLSWWLSRRQISRRDRLAGLLALLGFAVVAELLRDHSLDPISVVMIALPIVLTAWFFWVLLTRQLDARPRRLGLVAVLAVAWVSFVSIRANGLGGDQHFELHWRWTPTAEAQYLAARSAIVSPASIIATTQPLIAGPTDWPQFRGPNRDGVATDASIRVDWNAQPPKELWRHRIGPGWSSLIAVDDHLFTQEQRGDSEAVVCLNATSGQEIWSHLDTGRFEESQGGAGPRATPTYADGKLYSLSAMGILNCLDAATGQKIWTRDLRTENGAVLPMWGFASSPLVVDGLAVVYADGGEGRGLLSYHADSGQPGWKTSFGTDSYSSPQLVSVGGGDQIAMLSDAGVVGVSPKDGATLWTYPSADKSPRSVQPHRVDDGHMLIANGLDKGVTLVSLDHASTGWKTQPQWTSRGLKPSFNDFVVLNDAAYGLDANILSCIDLKTGERKWKSGRYGYGQVMLLAVQQMLLISTDDGEIVLVAADPAAHKEIARFKAIDGKTWNHVAVARGKLFIRNGQEIAAFDLAGK